MTTTKTTTLRLAHGRRQSPESANPCSSAQWPPASILLRSTLIRPNSPRRTVPFRRSELSPSMQKRAAPSNNTDTRTQKTSPPLKIKTTTVESKDGRDGVRAICHEPEGRALVSPGARALRPSSTYLTSVSFSI